MRYRASWRFTLRFKVGGRPCRGIVSTNFMQESETGRTQWPPLGEKISPSHGALAAAAVVPGCKSCMPGAGRGVSCGNAGAVESVESQPQAAPNRSKNQKTTGRGYRSAGGRSRAPRRCTNDIYQFGNIS